MERRGVDVYAYFNNDWEGFAIRNGLRLQQLLGSEPYSGQEPSGALTQRRVA